MATGTITATGATASVQDKSVDIHIADTSSFSGTIQVQRKVANTWVVSETITAADMPYDRVMENGRALPVRLNCSAFTSGTATWYMNGNLES